MADRRWVYRLFEMAPAVTPTRRLGVMVPNLDWAAKQPCLVSVCLRQLCFDLLRNRRHLGTAG